MATDTLYLDTARLGRMSKPAIDLCRHVVELSGQNPFLVGNADFLRFGATVLPSAVREARPELCQWEGIKALKTRLREIAGASKSHSVFLTSRSSELMKLAAIAFFRRCRNVLVVDTCWPGYTSILNSRRRSTQNRITECVVRDRILRGKFSATESAAFIANTYRENGCDGLFVSSVSSDGIRLPVHSILQRIESECQLRFAVVDGAQELNHTPADDVANSCDLYICGGHKWLGTHVPIGIGFCSKPHSRRMLETLHRQSAERRELDEPLARYVLAVESEIEDAIGESVSLLPLFACCGALAGLDSETAERHKIQLKNVEVVENAVAGLGWTSEGTSAEHRSGILMLRSHSGEVRKSSPKRLAKAFLERGIVLTACDYGRVRVSLPTSPLSDCDADRLHDGFASIEM